MPFYYLPNFPFGWSIIGVGTVVLLSLLEFIDDTASKYHLASPGRTFVFPCFRLIDDADDHVLGLRQRERCIVHDDVLLDEQRGGFSEGVSGVVVFELSECSGKWTKYKIIKN